ncbi:MAG TPA: M15 family metallopeptidase [Spirochaetota bacterium]|nr:M15 family metallopeptidase [Spirochaetota bacterium]
MSEETGIYLIPVFNYVTGRFNPLDHKLFVNLKKTDIPCTGTEHYLRIEAADTLSAMLKDFRKDNPKIKIFIISSTRNFSLQKKIWDEKWSGKRKVTGTAKILKIKDPVDRATAILKYSSMPGTSRHHWGTDFDINVLNNDYFTKGEGKIIYDWLCVHAPSYGFGQPYTAGRLSGYLEEKWHWSYLPLAKQFLKDWNTLYEEDPLKFSGEGMFLGSSDAGKLAPEYVNTINPECK